MEEIQQGGAGSPGSPTTHKTEFHQIYHEFVYDIAPLRDKYPLISVISMVVFAVLGFFTMFSFSPTNILSGIILLTLGGSLAMSIGEKGRGFWGSLVLSVQNVFLARGK